MKRRSNSVWERLFWICRMLLSMVFRNLGTGNLDFFSYMVDRLSDI